MKVEELMPIGTKVKIKDDEDNFKEDSGTWKTITGYFEYDNGFGYRLDDIDCAIFLNCDFCESKLPEKPCQQIT